MKSIHVFAVAALMMGMAACSNEENIPGNEPVAAQFTSNIEVAKPLTRVSDQNWDINNLIGITGTSGDVQYTNVPYRATQSGTDGRFTASAVERQIYFQNLDTVNFTAYYPYNEASQTKIAADTKKQSIQKNFDFLYATGTGSKANPQVDLNFRHMMSKVILEVKAGTDVSFADVKKAVFGLKNLVHEGTFDYADNGKTALTGTAVTDWTFYNNSTTEHNVSTVTEDATAKTITCTLILFPQEFQNSAMLTFTADIDQGGSTGTQHFSAAINLENAVDNLKNELLYSTQYTIPITINKTQITVGSSSIIQWSLTSTPGIIAEM